MKVLTMSRSSVCFSSLQCWRHLSLFSPQFATHCFVLPVVLFVTCIRNMMLASWMFYVPSVVLITDCSSVYRPQALDILSSRCAVSEARLSCPFYPHLHNPSITFSSMMMKNVCIFVRTLSNTMPASLSCLWESILIVHSLVEAHLSFEFTES